MDSNGSAFAVPLCPDQPTAPSHMEQRDAPPCGPDHENMQLQTRSRAQSAINSQGTRRSGRDTSNDARTSCSKRELPTTMARVTTACSLCPTNAPSTALSHRSSCLYADCAQMGRQKRTSSRCGQPSAAMSSRCRSSRGWPP